MSGEESGDKFGSPRWVIALLAVGWVMFVAVIVFAFFWPADWWPP